MHRQESENVIVPEARDEQLAWPATADREWSGEGRSWKDRGRIRRDRWARSV